MFIIDAHLDLAYNAMRGRDVTRPACQQVPDDEGTPAVGLPDLSAGGAAMICATIFSEPAARNAQGGYHNADEAHTMGLAQLNWYQAQQRAGRMRIVRNRSDVPRPDRGASTTDAIPAVLLLEGADGLRNAQDAQAWFDRGLRIVGLAWQHTRLAGGTGEPGPLTPDGVALVRILDRHGLIHDISHLAEESFWQLMDISSGPVMASHSNCRGIVPGDRQISDAMIRALAQRDGVIGINLYDKFLIPPAQQGRRRARLPDVVAQAKHICDQLGDARHVGLGTDIDGGFGREHLPDELVTWADLPKLGEQLSRGGFSDEDVARIMGRNWAEFFSRDMADDMRAE